MGAIAILTVLVVITLLIYNSRIRAIVKLRKKWLDILNAYHEELLSFPAVDDKKKLNELLINREQIIRANLYNWSSYIIDEYEYHIFVNTKQIDFKIINKIMEYDRNFRIEKYEVKK